MDFVLGHFADLHYVKPKDKDRMAVSSKAFAATNSGDEAIWQTVSEDLLLRIMNLIYNFQMVTYFG